LQLRYFIVVGGVLVVFYGEFVERELECIFGEGLVDLILELGAGEVGWKVIKHASLLDLDVLDGELVGTPKPAAKHN